MSGASVGAKHGIVFKTAASLQSIGTLYTAVLDKAGTITNGEPEVVTIVGTRSVPAKFLLGMAAGLEEPEAGPAGPRRDAQSRCGEHQAERR